jgi:anti-sigma B factor antagonist
MALPQASPDQFSVVVRRQGTQLQVRVSGDIDSSSRDAVETALAEAIDTSGPAPTDIRFQLSGVGFVDSTGLTVLVHTLDLIRDTHGRVVITDPPSMLVRLLEITNLTDQFIIELVS